MLFTYTRTNDLECMKKLSKIFIKCLYLSECFSVIVPNLKSREEHYNNLGADKFIESISIGKKKVVEILLTD